MNNDRKTLEMTLQEIESKHNRESFPGMIAGAYVLWLGKKSNATDINDWPKFLKQNEKDDDIRLFIQNELDSHWDKYCPLLTTFDQEILEQMIVEAVPRDGRFSLISHTPEEITELVTRILEIGPGDHVADFGAGIGEFLCHAYKKVPQAHYWGDEIATQAIAIAKIRAKILAGDITLVQEDMFYPSSAHAGEFDKAFCLPPWGMRLSRMALAEKFLTTLPKSLPELKGTVSGEWLFALKMLSCLKDGGRAILAIPPGGLFSMLDNTVRRYILERQLVEAVILLPAKLFDFSSVPLALVVFKKGGSQVRMINASGMGEERRRIKILTSENIEQIVAAFKGAPFEWSNTVDCRDVIVCGNMDPSYHTKNDVKLSYQTDFGDIIKEILRGAQLTATQLEELTTDEPTEFQYLALGNIKNGMIDDEALPHLVSLEDRYLRYCLQPNDIILSKIGNPFKVALAAPSAKQKILGNGNLFVIRVDESVADPCYVKVFLESGLGQSLLMRSAVGSVMPNLSVEAIKNLPISLPPLEQQREIAMRYLAKADEVAMLRRKLAIALDALEHILDSDNSVRA